MRMRECEECVTELVLDCRYVSYDYTDDSLNVIEGDAQLSHDCVPYCPECLDERWEIYDKD